MQRIAIGLESRHEEEKQLRETLAHVLALEKAKLRDEHRATASALKQIQKDHAARESAMETLYVLQSLSVSLWTRGSHSLSVAMRTRSSS